MTISRSVRATAMVALLLVAGMGVFPPWITAPIAHPSATSPAGYHLIFLPPSVIPGAPSDPWVREFAQALVGEPVPTGDPDLDKALSRETRMKWGKYAPDFTGVTLAPRFVRIDYARLLVQWIVVAALVGVVLLLPRLSGKVGR